MIYTVDFCIKENGEYHTFQTELVCALSVSECKEQSEIILNSLPAEKQKIRYFIED